MVPDYILTLAGLRPPSFETKTVIVPVPVGVQVDLACHVIFQSVLKLCVWIDSILRFKGCFLSSLVPEEFVLFEVVCAERAASFLSFWLRKLLHKVYTNILCVFPPLQNAELVTVCPGDKTIKFSYF